MFEIWAVIQVALATTGGVVGWYFGDSNSMLYALIAFTVLDFVLGILRHALVEKNLASERRLKRAVQKVLIFVLVGVANIMDKQVIGEGNVLRDAVIFFYLSSEGVSILEHASILGLPIPRKLQAILHELNKEDPDRNTDYASLLTHKHEKQKQQAALNPSDEPDQPEPKALDQPDSKAQDSLKRGKGK